MKDGGLGKIAGRRGLATSIVTFRAKTGQQLFSLLNTRRNPGIQIFTVSQRSMTCAEREPVASITICPRRHSRLAGVAQLVEQLICNHQVVGSSPITGSIYRF